MRESKEVTGTVTQQDLVDLELALHKITGVRGASVAGQGEPSEIHIVAASDRNPKQIVRDVQSLALAGFGIKIDRRIVSIVRLEGDGTPSAPTESNRQRPRIQRVALGNQGDSEWVEVSLRWPDGVITDGTGSSGRSREARARGATTAVVECLDKALAARKATVEVDATAIHRLGGHDWILVQATFYEGGGATPLLGSALVHDDVATAAARGLLNAVNRKLLAD